MGQISKLAPRWIRLGPGNISDHGDGAIVGSIQWAIDQVTAGTRNPANAGCVSLGPGDYPVGPNNSIELTGYLSLFGDGMENTRIYSTGEGTEDRIIRIMNNTDPTPAIHLEHFLVDGDGDDRDLIEDRSSGHNFDLFMRNIRLYDGGSYLDTNNHLIDINSANSGATIKDLKIIDCVFDNGIEALALEDVRRLVVTGCRFNTVERAIDLDTSSAGNIKITGNIIKCSPHYGADTIGGIKLDGLATAGLPNIIADNYIELTMGTTTPDTWGVWIASGADVLIQGNNIRRQSYTTSSPDSGVRIDSSASRCGIINNRINELYYGISSAGDYGGIIGNHVQNCWTSVILWALSNRNGTVHNHYENNLGGTSYSDSGTSNLQTANTTI